MKQVILIHGLPDKEEVVGDVWPSPSNAHWFPWVQKQLTRQDILCQSLEMPLSYNPTYKDHERVLNQMEISDETILVGHSCGGGFLLRYLSEHKDLKPKKVILVAPWLDLESYLKELNPNSDYFDFNIDTTILERTDLYCVYSTDDDSSILDSVKMIREKIPEINVIEFSDKRHFTEKHLKSKEFPELLEIILK
jgi:predicted alpha/beta hydrolase family esterase